MILAWNTATDDADDVDEYSPTEWKALLADKRRDERVCATCLTAVHPRTHPVTERPFWQHNSRQECDRMWADGGESDRHKFLCGVVDLCARGAGAETKKNQDFRTPSGRVFRPDVAAYRQKPALVKKIKTGAFEVQLAHQTLADVTDRTQRASEVFDLSVWLTDDVKSWSSAVQAVTVGGSTGEQVTYGVFDRDGNPWPMTVNAFVGRSLRGEIWPLVDSGWVPNDARLAQILARKERAREAATAADYRSRYCRDGAPEVPPQTEDKPWWAGLTGWNAQVLAMRNTPTPERARPTQTPGTDDDQLSLWGEA